jgi:predicted DNA-binding transcriptional regulator YafY
VAEYYATAEEIERPDGSLEVTLPSRRLGWVAGLLLRLGAEAEVLTSPELQERVKGLAAAALRRYQEP